MNLYAMNWEPYYSVSILLGLLYIQPSADWDGPNFAIQFGDKLQYFNDQIGRSVEQLKDHLRIFILHPKMADKDSVIYWTSKDVCGMLY